jgi:integrase/recombinase XerD
MYHPQTQSVELIPAAPPGRIAMHAQVASDEELIETWIESFSASANTRNAYAHDIREFRTFFGGPLASVTVRDIQRFAATLVHLAPATQSRRLSAVKSLIGLGHRMGWLPFDVGELIKLPGIKDQLAERILTEAQVQRLFYVVKHPRNAALLRLLYGAGLRVSEACSLLWRDMVVRDDAGQCTVQGKGDKTRAILLPPALWQRVDALRRNAGPDDAVFQSRRGGALRRLQVHRIMKIAVKRAGLPSTTACHHLRHSHASHALDRNCPVHVLQHTLGHASLTTTTRYSHVRPGDSSAKYLAA